MKTLLPPHQKALAEFLNTQLWAEIRLCLDERKPSHPDVKDPSHIAAAKGHARAGAESILAALEQLPFEENEVMRDPMQRPAVAYTPD